ncbi:FG-GAP-like repeat-containing protein [Microbulbifer sp. ALW1]|uniref:FG-GAP-like repeat-containing protein n=1 Tax=Microbulbifer sp. (strain ALW1) TaxID=1516059 RepID=UPI00135C781E|nr:FG-GAP-like repeat-containing protein [Microbulbifer sp. ALW1]
MDQNGLEDDDLAALLQISTLQYVRLESNLFTPGGAEENALAAAVSDYSGSQLPVQLDQASFSPTGAIDTDDGDHQIFFTVSGSALDDSPVWESCVHLVSPSGVASAGYCDSWNGTSEGSSWLSAYAERGDWALSGNVCIDGGDCFEVTKPQLEVMGFTETLLTVNGTGPVDMAAPVVTNLAFSATSINLDEAPNGYVAITVELELDDGDGSGVRDGWIEIYHENWESDSKSVYFTPDQTQATLVFHSSDAAGKWLINYIAADDYANNHLHMDASQIQAQGFPVEVDVTNSNPAPIDINTLSFSDPELQSCVHGAATYVEDLQWLGCNNNDIEDLGGIEQLFMLQSLDLNSGGAFSDLSPVTQLPLLTDLHFAGAAVSDLTPLSGLPIHSVNISWNPIADLSVLDSLPVLRQLWADGTGMTALPNFAVPHAVETLDVNDNPISDVGGMINELNSLPSLRHLGISSLGVSDISFLADFPQLTGLNAWNSGISDISVLADLPNLSYLNLSDNLIEDISPLTGAPLNSDIYLGNNRISDLQPLANKDIWGLDVSRNRLVDISTVSTLSNLHWLNANENAITTIPDLSSKSNFQHLYMNHNALTDITPLQSVTDLRNVDLWGNAIPQDDLALISPVDWYSADFGRPEITALSIDPTTIDLTNGSAEASVVFSTADQDNVNYSNVSLHFSPEDVEQHYLYLDGSSTEGLLYVPDWASLGEWDVWVDFGHANGHFDLRGPALAAMGFNATVTTTAIDPNIDTDGDGLTDLFEIQNGFDPDYAGDANEDDDNDGFSNLHETMAGTDRADEFSFPPSMDNPGEGRYLLGEQGNFAANAYVLDLAGDGIGNDDEGRFAKHNGSANFTWMHDGNAITGIGNGSYVNRDYWFVDELGYGTEIEEWVDSISIFEVQSGPAPVWKIVTVGRYVYPTEALPEEAFVDVYEYQLLGTGSTDAPALSSGTFTTRIGVGTDYSVDPSWVTYPTEIVLNGDNSGHLVVPTEIGGSGNHPVTWNTEGDGTLVADYDGSSARTTTYFIETFGKGIKTVVLHEFDSAAPGLSGSAAAEQSMWEEVTIGSLSASDVVGRLENAPEGDPSGSTTFALVFNDDGLGYQESLYEGAWYQGAPFGWEIVDNTVVAHYYRDENWTYYAESDCQGAAECHEYRRRHVTFNDAEDTSGDGTNDRFYITIRQGYGYFCEGQLCDWSGYIGQFVRGILDSDGDGMSDDWEIANGLDPYNGDDAWYDADSDGLLNIDEYSIGTNAQSQDSDADGLTDSEEWNTGLDPLSSNMGGDQDNDGFLDLHEVKVGTDPHDSSSTPALLADPGTGEFMFTNFGGFQGSNYGGLLNLETDGSSRLSTQLHDISGSWTYAGTHLEIDLGGYLAGDWWTWNNLAQADVQEQVIFDKVYYFEFDQGDGNTTWKQIIVGRLHYPNGEFPDEGYTSEWNHNLVDSGSLYNAGIGEGEYATLAFDTLGTEDPGIKLGPTRLTLSTTPANSSDALNERSDLSWSDDGNGTLVLDYGNGNTTEYRFTDAIGNSRNALAVYQFDGARYATSVLFHNHVDLGLTAPDIVGLYVSDGRDSLDGTPQFGLEFAGDGQAYHLYWDGSQWNREGWSYTWYLQGGTVFAHAWVDAETGTRYNESTCGGNDANCVLWRERQVTINDIVGDEIYFTNHQVFDWEYDGTFDNNFWNGYVSIFQKIVPPGDFDNDGINDNEDLDDDNDGIPDQLEIDNGLNPLDASDSLADPDADGYSNYQEILAGTDLNEISDFPAGDLYYTMGIESDIVWGSDVSWASQGNGQDWHYRSFAAYGNTPLFIDGSGTQTMRADTRGDFNIAERFIDVAGADNAFVSSYYGWSGCPEGEDCVSQINFDGNFWSRSDGAEGMATSDRGLMFNSELVEGGAQTRYTWTTFRVKAPDALSLADINGVWHISNWGREFERGSSYSEGHYIGNADWQFNGDGTCQQVTPFDYHDIWASFDGQNLAPQGIDEESGQDNLEACSYTVDPVAGRVLVDLKLGGDDENTVVALNIDAAKQRMIAVYMDDEDWGVGAGMVMAIKKGDAASYASNAVLNGTVFMTGNLSFLDWGNSVDTRSTGARIARAVIDFDGNGATDGEGYNACTLQRVEKFQGHNLGGYIGSDGWQSAWQYSSVSYPSQCRYRVNADGTVDLEQGEPDELVSTVFQLDANGELLTATYVGNGYSEQLLGVVLSGVADPVMASVRFIDFGFFDTDGDGMDDNFEIAFSLDLNGDDSTGDPDQDGLTNLEEFEIGTNPLEADSDGDGMDDAYEAANNLDPTVDDAAADADEDGATNLEEFEAGTDPQDPGSVPNTVAAVKDDFNGDGKSDIFWHNPNNLWTMIWEMDGTSVTSSPWVKQYASGWEVVAMADFNGDLKTDILWQNPDNLWTMIWEMDGTTVTNAQWVKSYGTEWEVAAVADFNADGKSDILWKSASLQMTMIWEMDGTTVVASPWVKSFANGWDIAAVEDFNGDGKADILWQSQAQQMTMIWEMDGATVVKSPWVKQFASGWEIASVADFNGDGKADILWKSDSLQMTMIWEMDGTTVTKSPWVKQFATGWEVAAVADFNGDGKSDILWLHPGSRNTMIWQMDGTSVVASPWVKQFAADWEIVKVADFNGDGKSDILWQNPQNKWTMIWEMDGTTVAKSPWVKQYASDWLAM